MGQSLINDIQETPTRRHVDSCCSSWSTGRTSGRPGDRDGARLRLARLEAAFGHTGQGDQRSAVLTRFLRSKSERIRFSAVEIVKKLEERR